MQKKTLVLGASLNESRYSNKAIKKLVQFNFDILAIGKKEGEVCGVEIKNSISNNIKIHTLSIYLSPSNQIDYIDFILKLFPHRIIFNPGAENPELYDLFSSKGINCENSCTLVLLSTKQY